MLGFAPAYQTVGPILIFLVLGYSLTRLRWIDTLTIQKMNLVAFRVILPVNLFSNICSADVVAGVDWKLLALACGGLILIFLVCCLLVPLMVKDPGDIGTVIQGVFRSNCVIFGITYVEAIYGSNAAASVSILLAFVIPITNILGVLSFAIFCGGRPSVRRILKDLVTNPLILAVVAAIFVLRFQISLPFVLEESLSSISKMASPLVIILLGGGFSFNDMKVFSKLLTVTTLLRLVVIPAIGLAIAVALGFRGIQLVFLLAVFGSPGAAVSYAVAMQMGGNARLAGDMVVVTTVCSIITIFGFLLILGNLSLL